MKKKSLCGLVTVKLLFLIIRSINIQSGGDGRSGARGVQKCSDCHYSTARVVALRAVGCVYSDEKKKHFARTEFT